MEVLIQQLTKNTFKCFVMITILQLQKKKKKDSFASCRIRMIDNFNKFGNVRAASDMRACQLMEHYLEPSNPLDTTKSSVLLTPRHLYQTHIAMSLLLCPRP